MTDDKKADRRELFERLADPATAKEFWERVADDVDWTVQGTHPLAGRYRGKEAFRAATFERLAGVLPDGVALSVGHFYLDGDTAIVELEADVGHEGGCTVRQHLLLGLPLRGGPDRRGARLPSRFSFETV